MESSNITLLFLIKDLSFMLNESETNILKERFMNTEKE